MSISEQANIKATSSVGAGVLEMHPKGHGFLRQLTRNFRISPDDIYVAALLLHKHHLRSGSLIAGQVASAAAGQAPKLLNVLNIEGNAPDDHLGRPSFDELTATDPRGRILLETEGGPLSMRAMDLLTPIGKGQRGVIVAPPRSGKTILLQQLAHAVAQNHPEIRLFILLVDERPEEVTEFRRSAPGEVIASSSDRTIEEHIRLAELTIDRAKRLAEHGQDVLVLLDSLTRLARAYNKMSNSGRTMSGGVDIRALDTPKRLFGAARAFDEGGSLTILATCLIETGSRMDDLIFQEFKGTGNLEAVLDRRLAERRVWPALDITQSGTRKEELLLDPETLRLTTLIRRSLAGQKPVEAMESLVRQMSKFPSNAAFLDKIRSASQSTQAKPSTPKG